MQRLIKQLLDEELKPSLKLMLSDFEKAWHKAADIYPVLDGARSTAKGLEEALSGLSSMLTALETRLDDAIAKVRQQKRQS